MSGAGESRETEIRSVATGSWGWGGDGGQTGIDALHTGFLFRVIKCSDDRTALGILNAIDLNVIKGRIVSEL